MVDTTNQELLVTMGTRKDPITKALEAMAMVRGQGDVAEEALVEEEVVECPMAILEEDVTVTPMATEGGETGTIPMATLGGVATEEIVVAPLVDRCVEEEECQVDLEVVHVGTLPRLLSKRP